MIDIDKRLELEIKSTLHKLLVRLGEDKKKACLHYACQSERELRAYIQGLAHAGVIAEGDRSLLEAYYKTKAEKLRSSDPIYTMAEQAQQELQRQADEAQRDIERAGTWTP